MSNSREKLPEPSVVTRTPESTSWPLRTSVMVRLRVAFGSRPRPSTSTWPQTGHFITSSSAPDAGAAHSRRSTTRTSDRNNRIGNLQGRTAQDGSWTDRGASWANTSQKPTPKPNRRRRSCCSRSGSRSCSCVCGAGSAPPETGRNDPSARRVPLVRTQRPGGGDSDAPAHHDRAHPGGAVHAAGRRRRRLRGRVHRGVPSRLLCGGDGVCAAGFTGRPETLQRRLDPRRRAAAIRPGTDPDAVASRLLGYLEGEVGALDGV